jgi:hypothetical protein
VLLDMSGTLHGGGALDIRDFRRQAQVGGLLATEDLTGTVANAKSIALNGQSQYVSVPDDAALRFGDTCQRRSETDSTRPV